MTATTIQAPASRGLKEVRALFSLALPIMVAQGGLTAMGIVDTFMIGRVSAVEMGGVALGNVLVLVFLVFGLGLTMGIEPLVSQAIGAGEEERAYGWFQQGLWAALLSSLPVMLPVIGALMVLPRVGVSDDLVAATAPYVWFRLPSIPINAMYGAARSYLTSVRRTRPVVIAVVTANVANVGLDYVFLFWFDMGAAGVAVATSICWCIMLAISAGAAYLGRPSGAKIRAAPDFARLGRVLRLGWPIGMQMTAELGGFGLVSLFVARMGKVPLGGHQIALSLASLTFMSAVGIAVASTAMVGAHVGAGRSADARRAGIMAIVTGGVFMGFGGVCFIVFNTELARLFAPTDASVARVGAELLQIAALFSVSDGVQVVSAGALRGVGDTKWPFYANLGAHWLLSVPIGIYLSHVSGFGVRGLWFGLTAGLTMVGIILTYRFLVLTRGELHRLGVTDGPRSR